MHIWVLFSLICLSFLHLHCHRREPLGIVEQMSHGDAHKDEDPPGYGWEAPVAEPPPTPPPLETSSVPDPGMMSAEVPIPAPETQRGDRIESLRFLHETSLCVQARSTGQVHLQPCDANLAEQKFLFFRSLDGRFQLQVSGTSMCLGLRPGSILVPTLLVAETCESKASQFFRVVPQDGSYSLRFDANNSCLDAENNGRVAGTRIILFWCSADPNQRVLGAVPLE